MNQYTPRQVPVGKGAVSHFAIWSDGKHIYFVAKDGICRHAGGPAQDLTTRDNIYSLFPHEGVQGQPQVYAGRTIYPPDYSRLGTADTFQLSGGNGFLLSTIPTPTAEIPASFTTSSETHGIQTPARGRKW